MFSDTQVKKLQKTLIAWQRQNGRHDLPWQQPRTPYRVWISEIMLQQTQVVKVRDYFTRFLRRFPDVHALADAPESEVLAQWSGLGYYARARNLHRAAKIMIEAHRGQLPDTFEDLIRLPGIGRSTAGAILALGYGKRGVILDGNVKRVLARMLALDRWPGEPAVEKYLWQIAEQLTPEREIVPFVQGWMDLGAMICRKARPLCLHCPWSSDCAAHNTQQAHRLPVPRPRISKPTEEWYLAVIRNHRGCWGLVKRAQEGIWGGLHCFPEVSKAHAKNVLARVTHILTHKKLVLNFVEVSPTTVADAALGWYHADQVLSLGLPAPVKRFFKKEYGL